METKKASQQEQAKTRGPGKVKPVLMTMAEIEHVGLGENSSRLTCLNCNLNFHMNKAKNNLKGVHELPVSEVSRWVVVTDSNKLAGGRKHSMQLEQILRNHEEIWKPMMCYVKCNATGEPVMRVEVSGLVDTDVAPCT